MDELKKYITEKLSAMQEEKEKLPTLPNMVTKQELFDAIHKDEREILNEMFREKKIKVHKTVHAPILDYVELVK